MEVEFWAENLGDIHEQFLSYTPQLCLKERRIYFQRKKRNYRKETGAYYTPKDLILSVLGDMERMLVSTRESEIPTSICDPACGSGRFLVVGARFWAKKVSEMTGEEG